MNIEWLSYKVEDGEEIANNTVCVLYEGKISPMVSSNDLQENLVYVSCIPVNNKKYYKSGEYVRCYPVSIVPRFIF